MGKVVTLPFNQARSEEYSGEIYSITVEDDAVILTVKDEAGTYCDYHLAKSNDQDISVGDEIKFFILPLSFNNEAVADEDFCFPIEISKPVDADNTECKFFTFPVIPIPSDLSKGP